MSNKQFEQTGHQGMLGAKRRWAGSSTAQRSMDRAQWGVP